MPHSSDAAGRGPGTEADGVADAMREAEGKKTTTPCRVLLPQHHAEARRPLPAAQAAHTG